ncbi:MAG: YggT family protein [Actinomycetota bacterium]
MSVQLILVRTLDLYIYILIARVVLSFIPLFKPGWSPPPFLMPVVDLVYGLTEPMLQLLRRVIPQPMGFPIDLSFIVLFILVRILQSIIIAA